MDLGLAGARVLVTGASQGLGAATARRFSLEGAAVVISSRSLDKLQATAAAINQVSSQPVFTLAADVTDDTSVQRLVRNTVEILGGLDVLVVNAGGPPSGSFEDFALDDWQKATNLTFYSALRLISEALPHLKKSRRASILAIQSMSVRQPVDKLILSNAIRPSVIGLVKSLSEELGPQGIRVNSILPGSTQTERIDKLLSDRAENNETTVEEEIHKTVATIALRRLGDVEEFANAAVFLCSPAASYITGIALPVDGGATKFIL